MRGQQAVSFSNISATTAAFTLRGGAYTLDVQATFGGGSVTLQRLGPDGTNYITADAAASVTAAGTTGAMALPPGQYRLLVTTATAVYATVARVPGE